MGMPAPATRSEELIEHIERTISGYGAGCALVAFSGGVDSSVVLAMAARALGATAVTAVTALSSSFPAGELEAARPVAETLGVEHRTIHTREVEREAYARNDALRCFHCKTELYSTLGRLAQEAGLGTVVLAGANAEDLSDMRPGLLAAEGLGVRNPLLELGVGKAEVRALARTLGLPVAEKPALACLSSRVAFGIRITPRLLGRIDLAEQAVRSLGFDVVRVRHRGEEATIEVEPHLVAALEGHPELQGVLGRLRALGWRAVRIDPEGYRQGSMNPSPV